MKDAFRGFRQGFSVSTRALARIGGLVALLGGALLASSPSYGVDVHFLPVLDITDQALGARSVFSVDIDGDGDLDMALVSVNDDRVSWQENLNGDGSAWALHVIRSSFNGAWAVHAGDIDGDGDNDVVATALLDDRLSWFENLEGDGSSWSEHLVRSTDISPTAVQSVDLDRDGDLDLISTAIGFDVVFWHENVNGDGSQWVTRLIAGGHADPQSIASGDFDLDGDIDIVVSYTLADTVSWFANLDGAGTQWSEHLISDQVLFANCVHVADVDRDGDPDILATGANADAILWFENIQVPFLWNQRLISQAFRAPTSVYAADIDRDGDIDVLSSSGNDDAIVFHDNLSQSIQWTPRVISSSANQARSVGAADLDGDGDVDVFSASPADNRVAWYENNTIHHSALFPEERVIAGPQEQPTRILAGRVDIDGTADLVSLSSAEGSAVVHYNAAGTGNEWESSTLSTASAPTAAAVGDGDRDGRPDVFVGSGPGGTLQMFRNEIVGWLPFPISSDAPGVDSIAVGDVDHDGDLDVVAASAESEWLSWYENDGGHGLVWVAHPVATTRGQPQEPTIADIDHDGDVDLVVAFGQEGIVVWLENEAGDGSAWSEHIVSSSLPGGGVLAVADIDHDGDLDVVTGGSGAGGLAWHENLGGDGQQWAGHSLPSSHHGRIGQVSAPDLDGDGDADILSVSLELGRVLWHENLGNGAAWAEHVTVISSTVQSAVAVDLDGDGWQDIATAATSGAALGWRENQGGQFRVQTTDISPLAPAEGRAYGLLAILVGNNGWPLDDHLELASLSLLVEDADGAPLDVLQAENLIAGLFLYVDDGSGGLDLDRDAILGALSPIEPVEGQVQFVLPTGNPAVEIAPGSQRLLFVVAEMAVGASEQTPNAFRVVPAPGPGMTARTVFRRIPLVGEHTEPVGSTAVPLGLDQDHDGVSSWLDCDDLDPRTYPGAEEVNDGIDNNCPGEPGYGNVDEITGRVRFADAAHPSYLSWEPQDQASFYQVSRSRTRTFSGDCLTSVQGSPAWEDATTPSPGAIFYYLVRPVAPHVGSWGRASSGTERTTSCPWPCDRRFPLPGITCP